MSALFDQQDENRAVGRNVIPVYQRLVTFYRDAILEHRLNPGDTVDSITQIQRKHLVSRETAKRVLNILEDEGYIVQQAGRGSFVADLRPKKKIWGIVVPFFSVQYEDLLLRVMRLAANTGREVRRFFDYNNWQEEVRLVAMMQRERFEAVVVIPTLDESRAWSFYSRLSPQDSHVVLFDHTMTYRDFNFVVQSYDLGVVRAMDYLLEHKPGGVVFIDNEGWTGRNMVLELMKETYMMVLRRKRPDMEPLILERASLISADELRQRGITGIFCCDDVSAVQAAGRLREQGVTIPAEMNLVSYGNTDLARFFTPAITSIDPHNEEMAAHLIDLLVSLEEGEKNHLEQYVVQPDLVVRET